MRAAGAVRAVLILHVAISCHVKQAELRLLHGLEMAEGIDVHQPAGGLQGDLPGIDIPRSGGPPDIVEDIAHPRAGGLLAVTDAVIEHHLGEDFEGVRALQRHHRAIAALPQVAGPPGLDVTGEEVIGGAIQGGADIDALHHL